jgi:hypothetical protein
MNSICLMKKQIVLMVCGVILLIPFGMLAQTEPIAGQSFTPAIEDNSMLIEEAYNQEDRVVQHISNVVFMPNLRDNFFYAFTQEWPAFGLKHQLSYTLQYNSFNRGTDAGPGDLLINYRYQLSYKESFVTCSPRLSLIVPTGNQEKGLGVGSWGLQANLPVSKRWTNHFINHMNLGTTYLFNVEDDDLGFNKPLMSYFGGISSIWLVTEKFNLMLECIANRNASPGSNNSVSYSNQAIVAPAFRFAIDVKNLQIVPGFSLPVSMSKSTKPEFGAFFYLSFEHPY